MSEKWVYLNGSYCREKEACIPVSDRGFLFGDGIFTTIKVERGQCEFFKEHDARLQTQARLLRFSLEPISMECLLELILMNQAWQGSYALKIIATAKEENSLRKTGSLLAMLRPYDGPFREPCQLAVYPHSIESSLAHMKHLAYLEHMHVRQMGIEKGCCDAVVCNSKGVVLETGCSNIFWVHQGVCFVPDPKLPLLMGVFLQVLLSCVSMPIKYVEAALDHIPREAHVFVCNALTHVRPVIAIGSMHYPRSDFLESFFEERVQESLHHS